MEKVALSVNRGRSGGKANREREGGVDRERLLELLQHFFGHATFRGRQLEAIETVLAGKDCFCLMPTGGGKSMCYEISALAKPGIVLVVSPLIALMQDQVSGLKARKIAAEYLCSTQTAKVKNSVYEQLDTGRPYLRLLYVTPELITTSAFISKLRKLHGRGLLNLIAVDEAHCISSWGHDFRPSYRKLSALKTHFPGTSILALTATASRKVQEDVIKSLCLERPCVLLSSYNRSNISYEVRYKDLMRNCYEDLRKLLSAAPGECCIVYCHSRATCDDIGARLLQDRVSCRVYHAGLGDKKRSQALEDWASGKVPVVVATVAFGMGIDRKDVRTVCHFNVPKSLEAFYQESGRAGRDGEAARSILYYGLEDRQLMEFLAMKGEPSQKHKDRQAVQNSLKNMESFSKVVGYCEEALCRRQTVLAHFGENASIELCAKTCDVCKSPSLIRANLEDLGLVSSSRREARSSSYIISNNNAGGSREDPSDFSEFCRDDFERDASEDEISNSDEDDEATVEARAVVSKGCHSSQSQVERKLDVLSRAEEAFNVRQGRQLQNGGASDKKAIAQSFRDTALHRLQAAVKQACERMSMTNTAAGNAGIILERECFQKFGKAGKSFYNSQLASIVRWLSTCSSSDLECRVGITSVQSSQRSEVPSSARQSLEQGLSVGDGESSLADGSEVEAVNIVTKASPTLSREIVEEEIPLPPIPSFNSFLSMRRSQQPSKSPLVAGARAPFKKPRLLKDS